MDKHVWKVKCLGVQYLDGYCEYFLFVNKNFNGTLQTNMNIEHLLTIFISNMFGIQIPTIFHLIYIF